MFEEVNTAVDHNSLLMDVMDRVSSKHKLKVLFHEKPFAGINGSGKHNNWSMSTDLGKNLLTPGKTPRTNLQFLTFFINTIAAVNKHEALLRATVASHGNDHRLGANEAPPAIISIFIGTYLKDVLKIIEDRIDENSFDEQDNINLRLDLHNRIPDILKDNTDRNRTSPFAFTGNKFEFRAVGSSAAIGLPLSILNTAVADAFKEANSFLKSLKEKNVSSSETDLLLSLIRHFYSHSRQIVFNGDGYSQAWREEAKQRGLLNLTNTVECLAFMQKESIFSFLEEHGVYQKEEWLTRCHVLSHRYMEQRKIEGLVLSRMALQKILPVGLEYKQKLLALWKLSRKLEVSFEVEEKLTHSLTNSCKNLFSYCENLQEFLRQVENPEEIEKKLLPAMEQVSTCCNELEEKLPIENWPIPTYYDLLFLK